MMILPLLMSRGIIQQNMQRNLSLINHLNWLMNLKKNHVLHDKLKHIEMNYHFIRDMVLKGIVKIQFMATDKQIADVLKNPLSVTKFRHFRDKVGME